MAIEILLAVNNTQTVIEAGPRFYGVYFFLDALIGPFPPDPGSVTIPSELALASRANPT